MGKNAHVVFHHSNTVLECFLCTLASWILVKAVTKYVFTCKLYLFTKVNMAALMNYEGISLLTALAF